MPRDGWTVAACLVILALAAADYPWKRGRHDLADIWPARHPACSVMSSTPSASNTNYVSNEIDAWVTVIVMDVWHWTSLVALLCYAGLKSIPEAYYQAAQIDGASRWAVFRAIQLPKMNRVLLIAVLLPLHGQFHDLYRAVRRYRRRARQFDHLRLDRTSSRSRSASSTLGKAARTLAGLQSDHPDRLLDLLHTVMTNAGNDRKPQEGAA